MNNLIGHSMCATGLLFLMSGPASAQVEVEAWTLPGWFEVDSLPDLDGDGFREIVHGDYRWTPQGTRGSRGRVIVVSGLTKNTIWEYQGDRPGQLLGRHLRTVGDVNGDGFPDVGMADDRNGYLLDGRDGTLLHFMANGWTCLEPLGDVNEDGYDDVLLAGAYILAGGSYEFILGPTAGSRNCAVVGDITGDGIPEYAVGFPKSYGLGARGQVVVYSGSTGEVLHHLISDNAVSLFGRAIASPGDFTGDSVPDFVIGESLSYDPVTRQYDSIGSVYFYDGRSGELVHRLQGPNDGNFYFGEQIVATGDVNGNGTGDLLIGFYPSSVYLVDGGTRETIYRLDGNPLGLFRGGIDWTGDGVGMTPISGPAPMRVRSVEA